MDDLDKKLHDLLYEQAELYYFEGSSPEWFEKDCSELINRFKKAFIDAGWQPVATPVLSDKDNVNNWYFDRNTKSWKVVPDHLMTGQEWYDRFEKEMPETTLKVILPTAEISYKRSTIIAAAKRAAGLE